MAWTKARGAFGVCGNFRYEVGKLTDIKATRSLYNPRTMNKVYFVASTNTTDNADVLAAKTLAWTGSVNADTENKINTAAEVFDPEINGTQADNTTDNRTSFVTYDKDATDQLFCHKGGMADAAYDLCPDGNEDFTIYSERIIQCIAADANDDGTLFIIGG